MTDFRVLCADLLAWAEKTSAHCYQQPDVLIRARAALAAEADGPAVPEGREPASVVGEPSDEDCWQWYTYCPEEGLEMYSDREQAQSAAQSIMGSYEVAAHSDGWHEDMESVSWGMLVPVEQAQVVECKAAEPDDEFDEWVKYELRPARYGHQPAPPAAGEVAELVEFLRDWGDDYADEGTEWHRAADLLERQAVTEESSATAPVPVGMIPVEYFDLDSGARIVTEPSEEGPGGCWVVLNSRHVNPFTEFPTAKAAWDALQQAHALPLPSGEVEHG